MKDLFTHGAGPFVTPLLAEFRGANLADDADHCVLEFRLEDGATLLAPIAIQAAESLNMAMAIWLSKRKAPPGTPTQ